MTDSINQENVNENEEKQPLTDLEKAAKEYREDMFKFKNKAKEAMAELERLKAEKLATEKARLLEKEDFKKLFEQEKNEKEALLNDLRNTKSKFVNSSKINAAVQALGGFKKSDYNRFINVDAIELREDGSIDHDSLNREVDRIKQEFPELLKSAVSSKLPDEKPSTLAKETRNINNMSREELLASFSQVINKK